jgi:hypothetical protein
MTSTNLERIIDSDGHIQEGDDTDGEYGLVVLWESKEDAEAVSSVMGPKLQLGLAGNVQGPPDIRLFEVIEPAP